MRTLLMTLLLAMVVDAQSTCPNQGARSVPGAWITGPRLGCAHRRSEPAWRLHIPPHRARARREGLAVVATAHRPCTLVEAHRTGLLLWPAATRRRVVVASAVDVTEASCSR